MGNRYEYGAFGDYRVCEEQVANRFGYTGQQYDTIAGQYYLRARYYNPVIARFTQEDTYYGAGLNLYAYCANKPIGYEDPSGHYPCQEKQDLYKKYREQGMTAQDANRMANYELIRKNQGVDAAEAYLRNERSKSGRKTDFYVTPNGNVVPATGYRYMDSQRAKDALTKGEQYTTYIGFTKISDCRCME